MAENNPQSINQVYEGDLHGCDTARHSVKHNLSLNNVQTNEFVEIMDLV